MQYISITNILHNIFKSQIYYIKPLQNIKYQNKIKQNRKNKSTTKNQNKKEQEEQMDNKIEQKQTRQIRKKKNTTNFTAHFYPKTRLSFNKSKNATLKISLNI